MERSAFARARTFLNYHPVAKWSALAAAVGTAVLFVVLLLLLSLFVELIVDRGDIPAYMSLSPRDQERFDAKWADPFGAQLDHLLKLRGEKALNQEQEIAKTKWEKRLEERGEKIDKLPSIMGLRLALEDLGIPLEEDEVDNL